MTDRFNKWFEWLLLWEGTTFENDPDDPGGRTKFGIDQRSHPKVDIKNLTKEGAAQIYWNEYWNAVHAEELPKGVGEVVANIAVNTGKGNASHWLQNAIKVNSDGIIGENTIKISNQVSPKDTCDRLLTHLEEFYKSIATGKKIKYLKGWLNRTKSLRDFITTL